MSSAVNDIVVQRIHRVHAYLVDVTDELTGEQLARRMTPTATPAGWHLWHIARWADRLQASHPNRRFSPDAPWDQSRQIWKIDKLASRWGLSPERLGILETGAGMADDDAAMIPRIGKDALLDYARRSFRAANDAVVALSPVADDDRNSIQEYSIDRQQREVAAAGGARVPVVADLAFHLTHANRHLGMIEALRGLLDLRGTATA